jgi:hypothetical protein
VSDPYGDAWRAQRWEAERRFDERQKELDRQRWRELPLLYRLSPWLALITILVGVKWAWNFRNGEILEKIETPCSYLAAGQYITRTCYSVVYRSGFLGLSTASMGVTQDQFKYAVVGGNVDDLPGQR